MTATVPPGTERRFPKLATLQRQIENHQAPDLRRLIRLRHNTSEQFRAMVSAIRDCRKRLQKDLAQGGYSIPYMNEPAIPKALSDGKHELAASHTRREYANTVHNLLLRHWNCTCQNPHTATRFCLTTDVSTCLHEDSQCNCQQARFDLLFCTGTENGIERGSGNMTWQQGQIVILNNQ